MAAGRLAATYPPAWSKAATTGSSRWSSSGEVVRERLGLDVEVIPGGHLVALSQPEELAARLEAYREEAGL